MIKEASGASPTFWNNTLLYAPVCDLTNIIILKSNMIIMYRFKLQKTFFTPLYNKKSLPAQSLLETEKEGYQ